MIVPQSVSLGKILKSVASTIAIPIENNTKDKYQLLFTTSCGCSAPKPKEAILFAGAKIAPEVTVTKTTTMKNASVTLSVHVLKVNDEPVTKEKALSLKKEIKVTFDVV